VAETPIRDRKARATRSRIAEAALELFVKHGYAETTIDQIADAADVGRRTVFRHFATKEAILFDHLVARRDVTLELLRGRPAGEPPLVSLHAVLREVCQQGYDRRALAQIRTVLQTNPQMAGLEFTHVVAFKHELVATLESRPGERWSPTELYALTLMALSWFEAATIVYFRKRRRSLVRCFDETVAITLQSAGGDLPRSLRGSTHSPEPVA
jgi:AcrR family transcriptional regulator